MEGPSIIEKNHKDQLINSDFLQYKQLGELNQSEKKKSEVPPPVNPYMSRVVLDEERMRYLSEY